MKIGILLVGRATDDLVEKYGTYAEMLISLINSEEEVFEFKTFNILDFKHCMTRKIEEPSEEIFKDIISIEKFKEGTNIIVVIQDGKIITLRTQGTFEGDTSYDTTETHYELFFKTLDEVGFGLSKFFDMSKLKPTVRYCFNFLMKLNFTPFPTFCDNEIHLITAYEINEKKSDR